MSGGDGEQPEITFSRNQLFIGGITVLIAFGGALLLYVLSVAVTHSQ